MAEEDLRLAARVRLPVLITAQRRDQRCLCARGIHRAGTCQGRPFVSISNEAIGSNPLVLAGGFEHAQGGTLFIDDVALLSAPAQAQLLQCLDHAGRQRAQTIASDAVRIIGGASRHLGTERASGTFSEGLFYRLNVIHLDLDTKGEG